MKRATREWIWTLGSGASMVMVLISLFGRAEDMEPGIVRIIAAVVFGIAACVFIYLQHRAYTKLHQAAVFLGSRVEIDSNHEYRGDLGKTLRSLGLELSDADYEP